MKAPNRNGSGRRKKWWMTTLDGNAMSSDRSGSEGRSSAEFVCEPV